MRNPAKSSGPPPVAESKPAAHYGIAQHQTCSRPAHSPRLTLAKNSEVARRQIWLSWTPHHWHQRKGLASFRVGWLHVAPGCTSLGLPLVASEPALARPSCRHAQIFDRGLVLAELTCAKSELGSYIHHHGKKFADPFAADLM
jgi:hypothetical protein